MKNSHRRVLRVTILMVLLLSIPIVEFVLLHKELKGFSSVSGVVVDAYEGDCKKSTCWREVIEYRLQSGEKNRIYSQSMISGVSNIGDGRIVLVNPQNSLDARDGSFFGVWFPFKLHLVLVSSFVFMVALMYRNDYAVTLRSLLKWFLK